MLPMFLSVHIFLLSSVSMPAVAHLLPEILAASYMLEAEKAFRSGDYTRARAKVQEILRLQTEHHPNLDELVSSQSESAKFDELARTSARIRLEMPNGRRRKSQHCMCRVPTVDEQSAGIRKVHRVGEGRVF